MDFAPFQAAADPSTWEAVRAYCEWQAGRREGLFLPQASDDVALRTYFLHLRTAGHDRRAVRAATRALKQFYAWAQTAGLIPASPFDEYDLERPLLSRDQIRRRQAAHAGDELARLRALNHLAAQLNRAVEVQTLLDAALAALVDVMGLRTAWAFLQTEGGLSAFIAGGPPPHDFAVAAACGLPPGLEQAGRHFLRRPPDCHCQKLLRRGDLRRAVNVVECTRLDEAAEAQADTQGLLFHASVPLQIDGRMLGILNVATEEWQFLTAGDLQLLTAVGAQVSIALERARLYEVMRAQQAQLARELAMAREVQASLLPRPLPALPGFSLAADWRAAREVAGDFYDVFALPGDRWGLVIADVSDKGAPAALYMAMVRSLLRAQAAPAGGPAAALAALNQALRAQCSADMFVSVFYAELEPAARRLAWANAGHNPPLLRRATGAVAALPRGGRVLGVSPEAVTRAGVLDLAPGEALVLYTDGVTEAEDAARALFGQARLETAVANAPADAAGLLARVLAEVSAFTGAAPQSDDLTLLVLCCKEASA